MLKACPYSEFFWSAFSSIWTEHGEIRSIQFQCGKMQARITLNTDTFYVVCVWHVYIPKCLEHLLNKTFEKFDVVISFIFCYCLCSLEDYHGLKIYIIKLIHWYVIKIIDFQVWWKFYSKWTLFVYDRGLHVPKKWQYFALLTLVLDGKPLRRFKHTCSSWIQ